MFIVNPYIYSGSYLLDTYSASAAYSLRQLKTGVTNVVRVRRSGDSAESDFTATDITDGTLTTWTGANDGFVVTWYDQGTAGRNITQATAASQPQIVSAGAVITKNSNPTIQFANNTKILGYTVSGFTELNAGNVWSYFTVGNPVSNNTVQLYINTGMYMDSRVSPKRIASFGGTFFDLPVAQNDTNQRLLTGVVDDTGSKTYSGFANGVANTPSSWAGTYTNPATFEIVNSTGIEMQEVIIFGSDESADRTDIESDINDYYSIY